MKNRSIFDLRDVTDRIASGESLQQIAEVYQRKRQSLWKWLHRNEERKLAYLGALEERAFLHAQEIEAIAIKAERGEIPADVARVSIDARKWIASRFHPKLLGERTRSELHVRTDHSFEFLQALKEVNRVDQPKRLPMESGQINNEAEGYSDKH